MASLPSQASEAPERVGRRLAAVVSADVVGYSRLVERDEEATVARLKSYFRDIVRPSVASHGGRIVKLMGDGALIEFPSVVEAVRSTLEIQEQVIAAEAGRPEPERIRYRVGIHLGDVIIDGEDIQGHGVNVAARLENLAEPGGICVSDAVKAALANSISVGFKDLGPQQIKNIAEPVHAYHLIPAAAPAAAKQAQPRRRYLLWVLAAAAIVAAIVLPYGLGFEGLRPSGDNSLVSPAEAAIPGLAVLPFRNLSDDTQQEFFVDGLTEDLILDLSNLSGLFVISRNSAFTYKGKTVKPQEVARELGVTHVLNGSVRRAGNQLRITAQLVEAKTDRQVWSGRYDRELTGIFAVQDEVKKEIIDALQVTLKPREQAQMSVPPTKNIEAYEYYLRGRQAISGPSRNIRSLSLAYWSLEKAISLDPNFAEAYAALALNHSRDFGNGRFVSWWGRPPQRARAQALALAQKAASLKPSLSIPEIVLAHLNLWEGKYDEAIDHARRAVEHEPGSVDAYWTHALVLTKAGLHREAKAIIDELFRRDPKPSPTALGLRGAIQFALHDYAGAIDSLKQAKATAPQDFVFSEFLFAAYGHAGRKEEAQATRLAWGQTIVNFDVAQVRFWNFHRMPEDAEHLSEGLRKAGAPELPFGFDPAIDATARLTGADLQSLLFGKSFTALCLADRMTGTVRFAANGATSWAPRDDLTDSGMSRVDGDKLCVRFPQFTGGAETCMSGYRNIAKPRFEFGRGYDFVFVGPDLCYFSPRK